MPKTTGGRIVTDPNKTDPDKTETKTPDAAPSAPGGMEPGFSNARAVRNPDKPAPAAPPEPEKPA